MTQYHYDRPPTAAVETSAPPAKKSDRDLRDLTSRLEAQEKELAELQQTVRRLQNELRSAVNSFNLRHHG
jgi:polyhydroxyalkanoate synthesis regulator phasin